MTICFVIFYHGWLDIFLRIVKKEKQAAPSVIDFCTNQFPRQKRFFETWVECYRILHGWPAVLHIFVCNPISPPRNGSLFSLKFVLSVRHVISISDFPSSNVKVKLCWKCKYKLTAEHRWYTWWYPMKVRTVKTKNKTVHCEICYRIVLKITVKIALQDNIRNSSCFYW